MKAKKHLKDTKRSHKGLLIKGSLERIPAGVMEDPAFRRGLRKIMEGWSGIYVLYRDDKPYYVGLATSSFWRLWLHFKRDKHSHKWNYFSVFRFKRVSYLKDLETLILHISKPKAINLLGESQKTQNLRKFLEMK